MSLDLSSLTFLSCDLGYDMSVSINQWGCRLPNLHTIHAKGFRVELALPCMPALRNLIVVARGKLVLDLGYAANLSSTLQILELLGDSVAVKGLEELEHELSSRVPMKQLRVFKVQEQEYWVPGSTAYVCTVGKLDPDPNLQGISLEALGNSLLPQWDI